MKRQGLKLVHEQAIPVADLGKRKLYWSVKFL